MKNKNKLIANITPTIHLFADHRNYILITRNNTAQPMKDGYHTYFQTIAGVFNEIFTYKVKAKLANDTDKTVEEMLEIIKNTTKEIQGLIDAFID